jgi:hypothetical protein
MLNESLFDQEELTPHWLNKDTQSWGGVTSWKSPDKGFSLLIEGYKTDDGVNFDGPLFPPGSLDVTLTVMEKDLAEKAYALAEKLMQKPTFISNCVEKDLEFVVSYWNISETHSVLLVGDVKGYRVAQDAWDNILDKLKIPFASHDELGQWLSFSGDIDDQIDKKYRDLIENLKSNSVDNTPKTGLKR